MTMLPGLPHGTTKVACGSCRKCCKGQQLIMLVEDDEPSAYDCYEFKPGHYALKRKPNGDCVYLGPGGCTIWGRHPTVCKVFDCAAFVARMDQGAFDGVGPRIDNETVKEGRKRLAERAELLRRDQG
jgi:Fe-S-cluster containining protein